MTRTRLLDQSQDQIVADAVIDTVEELGFTAEESIPGLVQAIVLLAEYTSDPEQALDEAANLLADTGRV